MSQGVVTNYFAKKRRGGYIQPSKRLKLAEGTGTERKECIPEQPKRIGCEIRSARRSARKLSQTARLGSKTSKSGVSNEQLMPSLDRYFKQLESVPESNDKLILQLSPASSNSDSGVVTAASDNHDCPQTPKRDRGKDQNEENPIVEKRGRVTPKKLGFDFKVSEVGKTAAFLPDTEFPAKTRLRRRARRKIPLETSDKEHESSAAADRVKVPLASDETSPSRSGAKTKEKMIPNTKTKRSRKNAVSEVPEQPSTCSLRKTKSLASKLLTKKKESPDALKEALKTSGNLKDLQETLMKIHEQKKKQKERESLNENQGEKVLEESKKDIAVAKTREFAYEKLHSLAVEIPKGLQLPYRYKILAELFRCADTVVSMLFNRQQVTTWATLQKSVKKMARKNFEMDHLGQIKSVFPLAYQYRQENGLISYTDHIKSSDYQLTIEPVLDNTDNFGVGSRKLTSGMLVKRKHHFLIQLVNIVKEHHKKFLSTLNPPIQIPDDKILRWHPQFPLDRIPDVEPSELPNPPNQDKGRCLCAKEVLYKTRTKFTKKAVNALKKVAEKASPTPEHSTPQSLEENNNITPAKNSAPASPGALKGVSQSLLSKIRAKEAEKKMKCMVRSEENRNRLEILVRLPDVARALRMLYVTEKKATLPLEYICEKLVKCCSGILSPIVVREHILLLEEHLPTWLKQMKVRNANYVKMNKGMEMAEILQLLQEQIRVEEKA